MDFLSNRLLPYNSSDAIKIKRKSSKEGFLFQKDFNQVLLRCLVGDKVTRTLKEV